MAQLHSYWKGEQVVAVAVPHRQTRDGSSALGGGSNAVKSMLDQARELPIFERVGKQIVDSALRSLAYTWVLFDQPWFRADTAESDTRVILQSYNKGSDREPFLIG